MVDERTNGSESHRLAAEAILTNEPVADEHVPAVDDLMSLNLAFPRNPNGTYAAKLHPEFR